MSSTRIALTPERARTLDIPRRSRRVNPGRIVPDVSRKAIPALFSPAYVPAESASLWLRPGRVVLGFEHNGDARAFPLRIMNWHEIVNDVVGGLQVVVTYCPLCRSGIVFDRRLHDGSLLSFGNTGALYKSSLVMFDRETESQWWQVAGEAIAGPLKGAYLRPLSTLTTTWAEWQALHPATRVLSRITGYPFSYAKDGYAAYSAGVDEENSQSSEPFSDDRLPPKYVVLGVETQDGGLAFALAKIGAESLLHAEIDGRPFVVVTDSYGGGQVFQAEVDGRYLRFEATAGTIVDAETGTRWDRGGRAMSGPLSGKRLRPIPTYSMYWFAWLTFQPDTSLAP